MSLRQAQASISEAIKVLKKGGVVVYPTETSYGLAVDTTNLKAVKNLYKLKGRDFKKPIHVIVPVKLSNTPKYWSKWLVRIVHMNPATEKLMKKFWPGPLTIVLPLKAKGKSWKMLSAGTKTLGVRLPKHKLALELVKKFGKPVTTTSANVSGKSNPYSTTEVKKQFTKSKVKPDFYLEGGKLKATPPSTVVSLVNGVKILRMGPISEKEIKNALSS